MILGRGLQAKYAAGYRLKYAVEQGLVLVVTLRQKVDEVVEEVVEAAETGCSLVRRWHYLSSHIFLVILLDEGEQGVVSLLDVEPRRASLFGFRHVQLDEEKGERDQVTCLRSRVVCRKAEPREGSPELAPSPAVARFHSAYWQLWTSVTGTKCTLFHSPSLYIGFSRSGNIDSR